MKLLLFCVCFVIFLCVGEFIRYMKQGRGMRVWSVVAWSFPYSTQYIFHFKMAPSRFNISNFFLIKSKELVTNAPRCQPWIAHIYTTNIDVNRPSSHAIHVFLQHKTRLIYTSIWIQNRTKLLMPVNLSQLNGQLRHPSPLILYILICIFMECTLTRTKTKYHCLQTHTRAKKLTLTCNTVHKSHSNTVHKSHIMTVGFIYFD